MWKWKTPLHRPQWQSWLSGSWVTYLKSEWLRNAHEYMTMKTPQHNSTSLPVFCFFFVCVCLSISRTFHDGNEKVKMGVCECLWKGKLNQMDGYKIKIIFYSFYRILSGFCFFFFIFFIRKCQMYSIQIVIHNRSVRTHTHTHANKLLKWMSCYMHIFAVCCYYMFRAGPGPWYYDFQFLFILFYF